MLLTVHDNTCSAHAATTSDHDNVAGIKLDKVGDFVLLNVELDGVVDFDQRVGVADRTAIVGDNIGDRTSTNTDLADL